MKFILFLLLTSIAHAAVPIPSPISRSTSDYQAATQAAIQQNMAQAISGAVSAFNSIYQYIWFNPNLTPQQAISSYGTSACLLTTIQANFLSTMNTLQPGAIPSPLNTLIPNSDCTVTVGAPYPTPSPNPIPSPSSS